MDQISWKRMFFLGNIHRTRRRKFSHSSWCSFNNRFFAPSLETMKKKLFLEKIFPETFLGKVEWTDNNLTRNKLGKSPKTFLSQSANFLQKKSFLIKKIPPRSFLWTRRREFLETRQLFFSRKCKLFRSKSENNFKKTPFSETLESFCFSSQSTSGHIGCVSDGPAEQSRTTFWTFFAQCPKRFKKVGNFVTQKFFLRKFIRTRIVNF